VKITRKAIYLSSATQYSVFADEQRIGTLSIDVRSYIDGEEISTTYGAHIDGEDPRPPIQYYGISEQAAIDALIAYRAERDVKVPDKVLEV